MAVSSWGVQPSQDDGRVALVSGGSRGIGAATVRKLAAAGWDISFCYRGDEPSAREVEKAASELGVRVTAIRADVTDAAEAGSWFRRAEDELGPVTAVVSCAGITRDRPLHLMAGDDWRTVIDAGLDGVGQLCRAAVSAMTKRRSGRIVLVSSVCAAYDHAAGGGIIARPGIAGFVKALAGQTSRLGVQVNAVVPGPAAHDMAAIVPERGRPDLTETIALRRFGDAAAVAELVAFLLSGPAAGITGTVLEAHSAISLLAAAARPRHPGRGNPGPFGLKNNLLSRTGRRVTLRARYPWEVSRRSPLRRSRRPPVRASSAPAPMTASHGSGEPGPCGAVPPKPVFKPPVGGWPAPTASTRLTISRPVEPSMTTSVWTVSPTSVTGRLACPLGPVADMVQVPGGIGA